MHHASLVLCKRRSIALLFFKIRLLSEQQASVVGVHRKTAQ